VNKNLSHDDCMQLLQESGLYVMVMLVGGRMMSDEYFLDGRLNYDEGYLYDEETGRLIDDFQKYQNTLGFSFWVSDSSIIRSSLLGKARVRDAKEYIKSMQYRQIPVGIIGSCHRKGAYLDFLNCGNKDSSIDFYEMNIAIPPLTGCQALPTIYDSMAQDYRNSSIPLLIDYGYPVDETSNFTEIPNLFSPPMSEVFSGGILFSWYGDNSMGHDFGEFAQRCRLGQLTWSLCVRHG
jgi:hypothetical protein